MTSHLMVANEDCCGTLGVGSYSSGFACLMLGAAIHPLLSKLGNTAYAAYRTGPLPRMMLHLGELCLLPTCWHLSKINAVKNGFSVQGRGLAHSEQTQSSRACGCDMQAAGQSCG